MICERSGGTLFTSPRLWDLINIVPRERRGGRDHDRLRDFPQPFPDNMETS